MGPEGKLEEDEGDKGLKNQLLTGISTCSLGEKRSYVRI